MAKHYGIPAARQEASPHDPYAAFSSHAASANPFNRQLGADVSYGAPLGPALSADLSGEFRAAAGGPVMDRAAAGLQTYLPQSLGGTGQDYAANLAANRAVTAEMQPRHPADAFAGNLAGRSLCSLSPALAARPPGVQIARRAHAGAGSRSVSCLLRTTSELLSFRLGYLVKAQTRPSAFPFISHPGEKTASWPTGNPSERKSKARG